MADEDAERRRTFILRNGQWNGNEKAENAAAVSVAICSAKAEDKTLTCPCKDVG